MGLIQIGALGFIILSVVAAVTFMFNSTKQSGITEQKIIQYQEIIKVKERDEKIAARPSSTVDELLEWLREHEE